MSTPPKDIVPENCRRGMGLSLRLAQGQPVNDFVKGTTFRGSVKRNSAFLGDVSSYW